VVIRYREAANLAESWKKKVQTEKKYKIQKATFCINVLVKPKK